MECFVVLGEFHDVIFSAFAVPRENEEGDGAEEVERY